jgi:hypothetical protein
MRHRGMYLTRRGRTGRMDSGPAPRSRRNRAARRKGEEPTDLTASHHQRMGRGYPKLNPDGAGPIRADPQRKPAAAGQEEVIYNTFRPQGGKRIQRLTRNQ